MFGGNYRISRQCNLDIIAEKLFEYIIENKHRVILTSVGSAIDKQNEIV